MGILITKLIVGCALLLFLCHPGISLHHFIISLPSPPVWIYSSWWSPCPFWNLKGLNQERLTQCLMAKQNLSQQLQRASTLSCSSAAFVMKGNCLGCSVSLGTLLDALLV